MKSKLTILKEFRFENKGKYLGKPAVDKFLRKCELLGMDYNDGLADN